MLQLGASTGPERPKTPSLASRLGNVSVLIADADRKIALLVKKVLQGLGFQQIYVVRDGETALALLQDQPIDLVITDWQMKPMDGIDFLRFLRQSPESPNRLMPVIMLTGRAEQGDVLTARDSGVTEFVVKPFSPQTLLERIVWVVEHPRSFILVRSFAGPDRRRKPKPKSALEIRAERKPRVISKLELLRTEVSDEPLLVLPDYAIKKKIGLLHDIKEIVEEPVIERTEVIIDSVQKDFLGWVANDMQGLKKAFENMIRFPAHINRHVESIRNSAYAIKTRSGTFGYSRASEVAHLLQRFLELHFRTDDPNHVLIIEKHIEALTTIFCNNIEGHGGERGHELLEELGRLARKYV